MHPDTLYFLNSLFRCTAKPAVLTLTALPPDPRQAAPSRHLPLADTATLIDALERLTAANRMGWSAVVGIATRRAGLGRWRRGGKSELVELPALFIDIDHAPSQPAFPLPPSCLVHSGHGLHAYFWLNPPTTQFAAAERILHGLAVLTGGDSLSAAQSMRLPGTLNLKYDAAVPCILLELHPERCYRLDDFQSFALAPPLLDYPPAAAHVPIAQDHLVESITDTLTHHYAGRWKANGWLAALCPCGHRHDFPGSHFSWNPTLRMGHCFGRHGRLLLRDLKLLLHL